MGQEGVDFDKDIKPLLGNPAVISATDVTSFLSDTADAGFVAALQVKDKDALDSLIEKTGAKKQGEVAGATVYQDRTPPSRSTTTWSCWPAPASCSTPRSSAPTAVTGCPRATSTRGLEGLPDDALARVYVDVQGLLGQSDGAKSARKIPWVAALRTLGLTVSAQNKSIDVQFNLRTEGDLSDSDLPVASGDAPRPGRASGPARSAWACATRSSWSRSSSRRCRPWTRRPSATMSRASGHCPPSSTWTSTRT